jgi:hypothetical protein
VRFDTQVWKGVEKNMLSERDYMNMTPEEKAQEKKQFSRNKSRAGRKEKLFALYSKEHKTFIDRIRIKIIENQNRKSF